MSRLGERLKQLRGEASLYDIEKAITVGRSLLSRYERGIQTPDVEMLHKLANHFRVPYRELRKLYYEDFFSDSTERDIVVEWAVEIWKSKEGEA